jgi:hypothetical protein
MREPLEPIVIDDAVPSGGCVAPEVYRAEGVLSVRLGITVGEAAEALRNRARRADRPLIDIAYEVLDDRQYGN